MRSFWWVTTILSSSVIAAGQNNEAYSQPSYPSPWGDGKGGWAEAYEKAREFVSQLTLVEKVNLTTGTGWMQGSCVGETVSIPRLGLRGLCLQDGPMGIRFSDYNSAFPAGVNIAATWDRSLGYLRGRAMGRATEGGRNWEGFSPDPVNTGVMMAETSKGAFRLVGEANGYACANSYTLNNLLKRELDFQGFVISDWGADTSGVSSTLAGLDMSMPGDTLFSSGDSYGSANLTISVVNGTVPEYRIDDMAIRIMAAYYKIGRDKYQVPINFNSWNRDIDDPIYATAGREYGIGRVNEHVDVRGNHASMIREIGAASTVLLKNTDGALPLSGEEKFTAVFGSDADADPVGINSVLIMAVTMALLPLAYNKIQALASQADVALVFVNSDSGEEFIVVDGNEGDRNNLTLWRDGDTLIKAVTQNNNTVVVIHSDGPVLVGGWYENPNVTAILWADVLYGRVNPGGKSPFTWGKAREDYSADVLYAPNNGDEAPQIDLTEEPISPLYMNSDHGLSYTTFAYSNIRVRPLRNPAPYVPTSGLTEPAPVFGNFSTDWSDYLFLESSGDPDYGLSADEYLPENATSAVPQPLHPAGGQPGGNPGLYEQVAIVTVDITNTGTVSGDEYISHGGPDDPKIVLRGFDRISLRPQETKEFSVVLTRRDISNWDVVSQNWVVTEYPKTVYVGSSSRELRLEADLSSLS
ncbi:hypothetical protein TSTA_055890 [Talaromyces stipitatus ATCC 10500]|uniref:beta-glucosidase n=1 Tax=Talaromyces stipitatus (strain ATCC 10500 / CBS 375.48 / QM 6759 / NRRL 1006) TaxID=441959 RepID=B8MQ63_TALSN|nr:uncharacterized protein TSTA_055890 [Talaromyces stipitatus ATCC 10500]EED13089.1 hypothetical protein TSTA_055890 [Talaromyces stipitatus ATCC 10500]